MFLVAILTFAIIWSILNLETFSTARKNLILLFASLILIISSIEAFIRIVDPLGISYYEETSRYHLDKIADKKLIYRHRSSLQSVYQGVEVRFNSFGLRDDPIRPKGKSEFRILVLGDSITFGWGVTQEEIFTSRLQKILGSKLRRPIRVINTGVGSYNTVQEYTYLKNEGLSFEPDLILLVYTSNDVEIHSRPFDPWSARSFKGKSPPEAFQLLLGESRLYRLSFHAWEYGWLITKPPNSNPFLKGNPGWQASMDALKDIIGICESHRLPLAIFFFRWQATPFHDALLEDVRKFASPYLVEDICKWFADKQIGKYMNSQVDAHPNSKGHQVVAEKIADYLLNRNLVSPIITSDDFLTHEPR